MSSGLNCQLILVALMLAMLPVHSILTLPLNHSQSRLDDQKKVKEEHNCSYVTYHNSRTHPKNHLRHDLQAPHLKNTYHLLSMGYFFTLPLIIEGLHYNINVDTGSSDIFIKGAGTQGAPVIKYSCPSCKSKCQPFMLNYLDGMVATYEKDLNVSFGTYHYGQHILVAFNVPHNFYKPQGVVGLSFPALAASPYPNFIQTLIDQAIIYNYSFGLNLNFQSNASSFITFGEPDPSLYSGKLNTVKLIGNLVYEIATDSLQIGNGPSLGVFTGILDSGNTCISIPSQFAFMIVNQFNTNGVNVCAFQQQPFAPSFSLLRCKISNFNILPDVHLYINNIKYTIDKNVYFQRCVLSGKFSLCDTYIETVSFGSTVFIGDGFFNQYYTYFDLVKLEVGIAKNKNKLSYKNTYHPYSTLSNGDIRFFNGL